MLRSEDVRGVVKTQHRGNKNIFVCGLLFFSAFRLLVLILVNLLSLLDSSIRAGCVRLKCCEVLQANAAYFQAVSSSYASGRKNSSANTVSSFSITCVPSSSTSNLAFGYCFSTFFLSFIVTRLIRSCTYCFKYEVTTTFIMLIF